MYDSFNRLDAILESGGPKSAETGFNRREFINGCITTIREQLEKLRTEELSALKEELDEDKMERFIINLTKRVEKLEEKAEILLKQIEWSCVTNYETLISYTKRKKEILIC